MYIIKNNLKLMLRSKWIHVLMIIGPIIVSSILISAFNTMMKSYQATEAFEIGYRLEEDSDMTFYIDMIKEQAEELGITMFEFPEGDIESLVNSNDLASFVHFQNNNYDVYRVDEYKLEGMTAEYVLDRFIDEIEKVATGVHSDEGKNLNIPTVALEYMPNIESKDYYSIVYIVYFIWFGFIPLSPILVSEKKNNIAKKFKVSNVSNIKLYLAKAVPCILAIIIEMLITIIIMTLMFDISWGNIPISILIIFLSIVASATFGLFIAYLFNNNVAMTIIAEFIILFVAGTYGCSFETYMYSTTPQVLKEASPIYHTNRALIESSVIGSSTYTQSCIIYLLAVSVICIILGFGIQKLRSSSSR